MKRMGNRIWTLFLVVGLAGCGGSESGGPNPTEIFRIGDLEYGMVDKGTLQASPQGLTGSGSVLFRLPRPDDDSNFALTFSLEPGGSLTLVANAGPGLTGGVRLTFSRGEGDKLGLRYRVGEETYDFTADYEAELGTISPAGALSTAVDVHGHGDMIVELGGEKLGAEFRTKVAGKAWGLVLDGAAVTAAKADKPKFPH